MRKAIHHTSIIRFRRWSRKGYAAFCSLGRNVTIGHLKKGVADASLEKQKFALSICMDKPACELEEQEEKATGNLPDVFGLLSMFFMLPLQVTTEDICISELTESIYRKICRVDTVMYLSGFFININHENE